MSLAVCRSVILRNSSSPISSTPATNQTKISDVEWITNGISFMMFLLAFIGNTAALIVMFASRGPIRLTNNKYLANLACADLLRSIFIPFTIIARAKRNFIFGRIICKILPIVQGLGVSVDAFTLVCISIERYLAICHPLLTLKLQSIRHSEFFSSFILLAIWVGGLLTTLPNFYMYNLCVLPKLRRHKCEMSSLEYLNDRAYIIALDILYLIIPMTVMVFLYTLIIRKMSENNTAMQMRTYQNSNRYRNGFSSASASSMPASPTDPQDVKRSRLSSRFPFFSLSNNRPSDRGGSTSSSRMDRQRRKALKLLIVLIVEFFVCWTPLYIYHTIGAFNKSFYRSVPSVLLDLFLLLSFASASCNPLTYYFMSQRYRAVLYANIISLCYPKGSSIFYYQKQHPTLLPSRSLPVARVPSKSLSQKRSKDDSG